jgi:sulfide:quinone oxidoreductase
MHRIAIIGAGFAALTSVQRIRALAPATEITLIAPHLEFLFYPSLIWIPSGLRQGEDLRIDLRAFLLRQGVRFGLDHRVCRAWHEASRVQVPIPGVRRAEG